HGLTMGPIPGMTSARELAAWMGHRAITGVIAHKGMLVRLAALGALDGKGVMLHLNGMTALGSGADTKERLTAIETAAVLGAAAVPVQANFTGDNDAPNPRALGAAADDAMRFGLPLLAMVYDKGHEADGPERIARLRHYVRAAIELGADAVKVAPPRA